MRSNIAEDMHRNRARRLAAMTPAERAALAFRLGEEGLSSYMQTHGVNRRTAMARIQATRQLGRRPSPCAETDEP